MVVSELPDGGLYSLSAHALIIIMSLNEIDHQLYSYTGGKEIGLG